MKLLKIIVAVFAIYFIRRFFQLYKAMKGLQEQQEQMMKTRAHEEELNKAAKNGDVIEADFKVIK